MIPLRRRLLRQIPHRIGPRHRLAGGADDGPEVGLVSLVDHIRSEWTAIHLDRHARLVLPYRQAMRLGAEDFRKSRSHKACSRQSDRGHRPHKVISPVHPRSLLVMPHVISRTSNPRRYSRASRASAPGLSTKCSLTGSKAGATPSVSGSACRVTPLAARCESSLSNASAAVEAAVWKTGRSDKHGRVS